MEIIPKSYLKKIRNFYLRKIYLRKGIEIGKNPSFGRQTFISGEVRIGDNFYLGRHSYIECNASIGDEVIISNYVGIIGRYDHDYSIVGRAIRQSPHVTDENYSFKQKKESFVTIGDDVWIGRGATILSGLVIHSGAIVAAGSVVTKSVPECTIVAGNPAKVVGLRFTSIEDNAKHKKSMGFK